MLKLFLPVLLVVFLAGCGLTPQGDAIRRAAAEYTKKVGTTSLQNSEWFMCEAAPIGAVKRRYKGDKADAYNILCDPGSAEDILKP